MNWWTVFPVSAKKCEIFFGIFALKFCEFRRFFSSQKPAFLFPTKNRRHLRFVAPRSGMSHKSRRKVAEFRRRTFFFYFFIFWDQHKIGEKDASMDAMTFFFWRSHWNRTKVMRKFSAFSDWVQNVRTISGIFAGGENLEGTLLMNILHFCFISLL